MKDTATLQSSKFLLFRQNSQLQLFSHNNEVLRSLVILAMKAQAFPVSHSNSKLGTCSVKRAMKHYDTKAVQKKKSKQLFV